MKMIFVYIIIMEVKRMIVYYRLWNTMTRRGLKKCELLKVIASATLSKLSKNQSVNTDTIATICKFLNCGTEDVLEYIPDAPSESPQTANEAQG